MRDELLRKDSVFLLERFYYLLEERQEHGLLVLDQVENRRTESSSDAWNGISLKLRRAAFVLVGLSRLRFLYRRI